MYDEGASLVSICFDDVFALVAKITYLSSLGIFEDVYLGLSCEVCKDCMLERLDCILDKSGLR